MLGDIFFTVILCSLVNWVLTQPRRCLSWILTPLKRWRPEWASTIDVILKEPESPRVISAPTMFPPCGLPVRSGCCPSDDFSEHSISIKSKPLSFEELVKAYEAEHGTKVIIIHHGDTTGITSIFSKTESLSDKDARQFVEIMRTVDTTTPITLILNTNGGSMTSAEVIVHALVNHQGPISVYVPHTCMSAGTLIALTATEMYMDPNAYCGTIDPQMVGVSATSIIGYCETYAETSSFLGDLARLLLSQAQAAMTRVRGVLDQIPSIQDTRSQIELELVSGRHNHDKPLFVDEMSPLTKVTVGIPPPILELYRRFLDERKPTSSSPFGF